MVITESPKRRNTSATSSASRGMIRPSGGYQGRHMVCKASSGLAVAQTLLVDQGFHHMRRVARFPASRVRLVPLARHHLKGRLRRRGRTWCLGIAATRIPAAGDTGTDFGAPEACVGERQIGIGPGGEDVRFLRPAISRLPDARALRCYEQTQAVIVGIR
jgi:hypothetical protein